MNRTPRRMRVLLSSVSSDAHTWNLVFLQLLVEELGHAPVNLGACVPDELLVDHCRKHPPDLVVISSVNGHGHHDGRRVIRTLRACAELAATPVVIGGQLGVSGSDRHAHVDDLLAAGFDAVFDGGAALDGFRRFVWHLAVAEVVAA